MSDSQPQSRTGLAIALICVAIAGIVVWSIFLRDEQGQDARERDRLADDALYDDSAQQIELMNVGIGHLENEDYSQSDAAFLKLSQSLPSELLGPRNLVITRILRLRTVDATRDPDRHRRFQAEANDALESLRAVEGDSFAVHFLAARLAIQSDDVEEAVRALEQAAQLAPHEPTVWYEIYRIARDSDDPLMERAATDALATAQRLEPENIALLLESLQPRDDTNNAKESIVASLKNAGVILEFLAPGIESKTNVDLPQLIDDSIAAALADDRSLVSRNVRILSNVVRPEDATQSDLRRIHRNILDFVIDDFSADFYEKYGLVRTPPSAPTMVKMLPLREKEQLPQLERIKAAQFADVDLDGRLDVIVLHDDRLAVYSRATSGSEVWHKMMERDVPVESNQFLVADLDNDFDRPLPENQDTSAESEKGTSSKMPVSQADVDFVVYGQAGPQVLLNQRNRESGDRELVLLDQGPAFNEQSTIHTAIVADLDHDGDLDLAISSDAGISFWSNSGSGRFQDVSALSQLSAPDQVPTLLVPFDSDDDVDIDMLACGLSTQAGILENLRHGRFRHRIYTGFRATWYAHLQMAKAVELLDADANGTWDILAASANGISLAQMRSPRERSSLSLVQVKSLSKFSADGLLAEDFDNDGIQDFIAWNPTQVELFRGNPGAAFTREDVELPETIEGVQHCDAGDLDGDGDIDLLVATTDRVLLYSNEGGNRNNWIDIRLHAEQVQGSSSNASGRVNSAGIGSLLELKQGAVYQKRMVTGQNTHFGLGTQKRPDIARVLWTNGIPQNLIRPESNQTVYEKRVLKGSCPYAYGWNGTRYEFLTDLLWAAPLGLQLAEGVVAPSREWEYLKIPGQQLAVVDGQYRLQITEELWEAAYFDTVQLLAVDHPQDVEIYTNEKVGPAEIAAHRIHTVRSPHTPLTARDSRGNDLSEQISHRDDVYAKAFDRRIRQGLVEEYFIELDLGERALDERIMLFMTGWIFPTDTSLNVALSEDDRLPSPSPPSLWVPDVDGEWKMVRPYTGFPGGKTKTVAIDLSETFLTDDFRVRIVTNMEFYWDHIFFTIDEPDEAIRVTELALLSADLHSRGFSQRLEHAGYGPESYDYHVVDPAPRWPPLQGKFTRYGAVEELVRSRDGQLVVLGAGDEMSLVFEAPLESPPAGWQRDFILHSVGWDKDADLNTIYGQTVEPLPTSPLMQSPPVVDSPEHLTTDKIRNTDRFRTRRQNPDRFWSQIRRFDSTRSD